MSIESINIKIILTVKEKYDNVVLRLANYKERFYYMEYSLLFHKEKLLCNNFIINLSRYNHTEMFYLRTPLNEIIKLQEELKKQYDTYEIVYEYNNFLRQHRIKKPVKNRSNMI